MQSLNVKGKGARVDGMVSKCKCLINVVNSRQAKADGLRFCELALLHVVAPVFIFSEVSTFPWHYFTGCLPGHSLENGHPHATKNFFDDNPTHTKPEDREGHVPRQIVHVGMSIGKRFEKDIPAKRAKQ